MPNGCKQLRAVCSERGIVLIFDEVFVGFRLAPGGAQEYFGVKADMVTYGKTLGGGLPVGVVCGRARADEALPRRPAGRHLLRARHVQLASLRDGGDARVPAAARDAGDPRALYATSMRSGTRAPQRLNQRLRDDGLPVQVANLSSIWTVCYTQPSRYNWMLQYYLRAEGLALSWIGTGRLIFSLNYTRRGFRRGGRPLRRRRARRCSEDGWWWADPAATNKSIKRAILREMLAHRFLAQSTPDRIIRCQAPAQARLRRCASSSSCSMPRMVRIDQLAAQQIERRLVVELDVVERVGEDLGHPHEAGLHVLDEEQLHGAEQQAADADASQSCADVAQEVRRCWRAA